LAIFSGFFFGRGDVSSAPRVVPSSGNGRFLGRGDFLGAAMSVSYDNSDGANGTSEKYFGMSDRVPAKKAGYLVSVSLRARVTQRSGINNTQPAQKVLRVISVSYIPANTKPCAFTVLCLIDKLGQRVSKPCAIADPESMFSACILRHQKPPG